jgi:hypothetical protein
MHHNDDEENDDVRQREHVAVVLRSELIRHVLELPNEARAKLLAFLHLAEDLCTADANLHTDPSGEIQVRLVSRKNGREDSRPAAGKSPVQLQ